MKKLITIFALFTIALLPTTTFASSDYVSYKAAQTTMTDTMELLGSDTVTYGYATSRKVETYFTTQGKTYLTMDIDGVRVFDRVTVDTFVAQNGVYMVQYKIINVPGSNTVVVVGILATSLLQQLQGSTIAYNSMINPAPYTTLPTSSIRPFFHVYQDNDSTAQIDWYAESEQVGGATLQVSLIEQ